MAASKQPRGICAFCNFETTKGAMTKHLEKCPELNKALEAASTKAKGKGEEELLYLRVQDACNKTFWLDLEMSGSASLKKLDEYLRAIWLECCGHLSEFAGDRKIGMTQKADKVFETHSNIVHIYDFGTSSETTITHIGTRTGVALTKHPIALLARNSMPVAICAECEEPATHLCPEPMEEGKPFLFCAKHAAQYEDSDYRPPVELVNSPRLGMCGYIGPANPPY